MTIKSPKSNKSEAIERIEFSNEATKFDKESQYFVTLKIRQKSFTKLSEIRIPNNKYIVSICQFVLFKKPGKNAIFFQVFKFQAMNCLEHFLNCAYIYYYYETLQKSDTA